MSNPQTNKADQSKIHGSMMPNHSPKHSGKVHISPKIKKKGDQHASISPSKHSMRKTVESPSNANKMTKLKEQPSQSKMKQYGAVFGAFGDDFDAGYDGYDAYDGYYTYEGYDNYNEYIPNTHAYSMIGSSNNGYDNLMLSAMGILSGIVMICCVCAIIIGVSGVSCVIGRYWQKYGSAKKGMKPNVCVDSEMDEV